jgi:8-oxo-dGTP pyrophosphatase MutT (NUDIX family)
MHELYTMGAGVLPVTLYKGELYFLFGEEFDEHKWIDFGGGAKPGESTLQNAMREACEELNGFFGSCNEIKQLIKENLVLKLNLESQGNKTYTTFIVQVPYDPHLPFYFNNHHKFIKTHLPHLVGKNGLFEKRQIRWMTLADIKEKRSQFRHYYKPMLDQLAAHEAILLGAIV